MKLRTKDFHFHLPKKLIAQQPLAKRESSRMLVLDKKDGSCRDNRFMNIGDYLKTGDVVVVNNSQVVPCRLKGTKRETKGKIEATLIEHKQGTIWSALINKKVKEGLKLIFSKKLVGKVLGSDEQGHILLSFNGSDKPEVQKLIEKTAIMPLPPYIKRKDSNFDSLDRKRYQTVYAEKTRRCGCSHCRPSFFSKNIENAL